MALTLQIYVTIKNRWLLLYIYMYRIVFTSHRLHTLASFLPVHPLHTLALTLQIYVPDRFYQSRILHSSRILYSPGFLTDQGFSTSQGFFTRQGPLTSQGFFTREGFLTSPKFFTSRLATVGVGPGVGVRICASQGFFTSQKFFTSRPANRWCRARSACEDLC